MKITVDGVRYNLDVDALAVYIITYGNGEKSGEIHRYLSSLSQLMFEKHRLKLYKSQDGFVIFDIGENLLNCDSYDPKELNMLVRHQKPAVYSQLDTFVTLSKMIREFSDIFSYESKILKLEKFQKSAPKPVKKTQ
jgi:hypothetical protein